MILRLGPPRCLFVALVLEAFLCSFAYAQVGNSYGTYYQKQARQPGTAGVNNNVNRYLYEKYFYSKGAVNPTMSLGRRSNTSSYYQYVKPEQERRAAAEQAGRAYVQQRKLQGNVGTTNYGLARQLQQGVPSAKQIPSSKQPSPYFNQYYGNQRR